VTSFYVRQKSGLQTRGGPLRKVIEEALRFYLGKRPKNKKYELKWRTEKGRMLSGVRLDDRDALLDLMEGRT
jgi:hypothetical protein